MCNGFYFFVSEFVLLFSFFQGTFLKVFVSLFELKKSLETIIHMIFH